jgi:hypothetical protein
MSNVTIGEVDLALECCTCGRLDKVKVLPASDAPYVCKPCKKQFLELLEKQQR